MKATRGKPFGVFFGGEIGRVLDTVTFDQALEKATTIARGCRGVVTKKRDSCK